VWQEEYRGLLIVGLALIAVGSGRLLVSYIHINVSEQDRRQARRRKGGDGAKRSEGLQPKTERWAQRYEAHAETHVNHSRGSPSQHSDFNRRRSEHPVESRCRSSDSSRRATEPECENITRRGEAPGLAG